MKLREYLKDLNERVKETPSLLDAIVIHSIDEEGNWFQMVHFHAAPCKIEQENSVIISDVEFDVPENECNAICIN